MISAELNYREYESNKAKGSEFASLHFNGNAEVCSALDKLGELIKYERAKENAIKIEHLTGEKNASYTEWETRQKEMEAIKRGHLFWMFSRELRETMRTLEQKSEKLVSENARLSVSIYTLERQGKLSGWELANRYKDLLAKLEFSCKDATRTNSNMQVKIYESTCSDAELLSRANEMISRLEQEQYLKRKEIQDSLSQPKATDGSEMCGD